MSCTGCDERRQLLMEAFRTGNLKSFKQKLDEVLQSVKNDIKQYAGERSDTNIQDR